MTLNSKTPTNVQVQRFGLGTECCGMSGDRGGAANGQGAGTRQGLEELN